MKNTMRGQIQIGTLITALMGMLGIMGVGGGFIITAFNKNTDAHLETERRISVVETRTERIPIIEEKIDKLLEKQGIKFISNLATSTPYDGK